MTRSGSLPIDRLSMAERRVFDLLLEGRTTADIAGTLVLSEATVRTHLSHIYAKLGVRGRSELLVRAVAPDGFALTPGTTELVGSANPTPGDGAWALAAPPEVARLVTTATIALAIPAILVTPKAAAFFGPLLLVLGVRLPARPGSLSGWLRVAAILLGLALWVTTVWLVGGTRAP